MSLKASLYRLRGNHEKVREEARRAKDIYLDSGDVDGTLKAMALIASSEQMLGNATAVSETRDEARRLREGLEVSRAYVVFASELANVFAQQGDIKSALEELSDVEKWAESRGNVKNEAQALATRAQLLQAQGALIPSNEAIDKGITLLAEEKGKDLAFLYFLQALNLAMGGEYKASELALDRALRTEPRFAEAGMGDMVRGMIAYGRGNLEDAEQEARGAVGNLKKFSPAFVSYATLMLIPILIEEGRVAEARLQYEQSRAMMKEARGHPAMSLAFQTVDAMMLGQSDRKDEVAKARQQLTSLSAQAQTAGLAIQHLEAEIQLARLELASGAGAAGKARLGRVIGDAERRGLRLYASVARRVPRGGKN